MELEMCFIMAWLKYLMRIVVVSRRLSNKD